jgi:hypothetical protein
MEAGSPGEDLSEFEVETQDRAPPYSKTLTVLVLARRRLLHRGLLLCVVLRTLELKSSVLARLRLVCRGLLLSHLAQFGWPMSGS